MLLEWLLSPIDADRIHQVDFFISWHGRFMTLAWGFLTPIGIIIARYFKVLPSQNWPQELDNQAWWNCHRICQYSTCLFMAIAIGLILYGADTLLEIGFHKWVGWAVVILTLLQVSSGIFRGSKGGPTEPAADGSLRGDHYDMSTHRVIFEYFHKLIGYLLILASSYCIITGMWIANAPNWMWIVICTWWLFLLGVFWYLQFKGKCLDTYQAIWGPDKDLPGNKRKPIGFGIKSVKQ
jgi:hypothetical protein